MTPEEYKEQLKDTIGRWRTTTLFEETCEDPTKYPPIFTLKDSDTASCVSLKDRYLELRDITEYKFANIYLGGWDHWQRICESWRLKPHIAEWREQLRLKLKQEAIERILEIADSSSPGALNAAKQLLDMVSNPVDKPKRGRPSKEEKEGHLAREAKSAEALRLDAERVGIKVVK